MNIQKTIRSTTNGSSLTTHETDWRRAAMEQALHFAADDGTPAFALLNAFQQHLPGHEVRLFSEDRLRLLSALRRHLSEMTPVFAQALYRSDDEATFPSYGWWHAALPGDEAVTLEIILSPAFYGSGSFVIAGPDGPALDTLVERVLDEAARPTSRCLRFASSSWHDAPEMESETDKITWDDIVLPPALITDIRATIDAFFTQQETFRALRFPWRRGMLLVGPPGTGKTMVCKAAAATYRDVPFLYVRDLTSRGMQDVISQIFSRARKLAPCILAIEDIDGLIGKDNRTVFLNELDGFRNNDGILIIASSNHPERIDEALLKRPSRFDRVYHIGLPDRAERAEYCRRILARLPNLSPDVDIAALSERAVEGTEGFTPAFLKEAFLSAVLQMAQEGRYTLDEAFAAAVLEQVDTLRKYLKKAKNPEALADFQNDASDNIGFRAR